MAQGDVAHIEFGTSDLAASRRFYERIFGWHFEDVPGMEKYMKYMMFATPSGQGGGFDAGPRSSGPSAARPILHIEVSDIDPTLARISEMGGKTFVPKTKISDEHGHFALFLDNAGNRLGVWSQA
jgi:predicted enzyme related to lactoylglutathione lyase